MSHDVICFMCHIIPIIPFHCSGSIGRSHRLRHTVCLLLFSFSPNNSFKNDRNDRKRMYTKNLRERKKTCTKSILYLEKRTASSTISHSSNEIEIFEIYSQSEKGICGA